MTTSFKYEITANNKAKVRNIVVLALNAEKVEGIDLAYLSKDEAKACKKAVKNASVNTKEILTIMKPYIKAYRTFKISKIIK